MIAILLRLWPLLLLASSARADAARIPEASELPLSRGQTLAIGLDGRNDKQGTLAPVGNSGFELVYQSGKGVDLRDLQLYSIRSEDGRNVGAPRRLELVDHALAASPAFVATSEGVFLYFSSSPSFERGARFWRAAFDGKTFDTPTPLPPIAGLERIAGWPQWVASNEGVSLSFRDRRNRPRWGLSGDARNWTANRVEDVTAAYVRVVRMTGGGWFLSYQRKPAGINTVTYARFSVDGVAWSAPEPVTVPSRPALDEVHDAYALPRNDRGVDLYYSYPAPKNRVPMAFQLYRRALFGPGDFGPEELVTEAESFDPYSSSAHRLQDGKVLLTFSDIERDSNRGVVQARLHLVELASDAPAPRSVCRGLSRRLRRRRPAGSRSSAS